MKECLSKLMANTDAALSERGGKEGGEDGTNVEEDPNDTLSKIQEMLNTTKVHRKELHVYNTCTVYWYLCFNYILHGDFCMYRPVLLRSIASTL